jgi:hypothetical protein
LKEAAGAEFEGSAIADPNRYTANNSELLKERNEKL